MEEKTTLSQSISATDQKAHYDAACKKLLSEKQILARIMQRCISEYADCSIEDIATKYIEGTPLVGVEPVNPDMSTSRIRGEDTEDKSVNEGIVRFDIKFQAIVPTSKEMIGLIINVEAQNDSDPGYPLLKRAIYYCSRMISSQYVSEFTSSHYEKIKKVYSIWICLNPKPYQKNSINRYEYKEEHLYNEVEYPDNHYDLSSVVMINLGDIDAPETDDLLRFLGVLLSSQLKEVEKKSILQDEYHLRMTEKLEQEVSTMCNLSIGVERQGFNRGVAVTEERKNIEAYWILKDVSSLSDEEICQRLKIEKNNWTTFLTKATENRP